MKKPVRDRGLKWIQDFLRSLCKRHPGIYTAGYLGSFLLLVATGAATPFAVNSIGYSIGTQQSRETGIIEEVIKQEEKIFIFGRGARANTYFDYQFLIDGIPVRVLPKDCRDYKEGDSYSYFLYTRNGNSVGDCRDYKLWQGILILVMTIIILAISAFFLFTETSSKELAKKEELEKLTRNVPERPKLGNYSIKELYEKCLLEGITVPKNKCRDRKYLMNCLMGVHETKTYRYQLALKEQKQKKVMDGVFAIIVFLMAVNYMRHGFYLFQLFFR